MKFQPVIKWTGSKRTQSEKIVERFPKEIDTYYEPFVGGGSIFRQLTHSDIKVNKFVCSDINKDLITLWQTIKDDPEFLSKTYRYMWKELNKDSNIERKKEYYNTIRERCNVQHLPQDFLFISRTTVNGLIRYNKSGNLNNSFHLTRNGIEPNTLKKIIFDWSNILNEKNVCFHCDTYENIVGNDHDLIYLDPPYAATKGIYNGTIDYNIFWNWIRLQKSKYVLSFDGKTDKEDYTFAVPKDIYKRHEYLFAGNSSFRRIIGKSLDTDVSESLYLSW